MKKRIRHSLSLLLISIILGLIICFVLGDRPAYNFNSTVDDQKSLPANKESLKDMAKSLGLNESDIKAARSILNNLNK